MLQKRKLKNKVRVTFLVPPADGEEEVYLVGDMNGWDESAIPMKRNENGEWEAQVDLEPNREYQFRYRLNGGDWRNDPSADSYVTNPFGSENSVVSTTVAAAPRRTRSKRES